MTKLERAILAHVVADPDGWVEHALATVGPAAVSAKIEKYRALYESESVKPGYKSRVERDTDADKERAVIMAKAGVTIERGNT